MRIARLFDGVDADGKAVFAPGRMIISDFEERARVKKFLSSGKLIERTTGRDIDRIGSGQGKVVPLQTRTDGSWIWNEALAYYVEFHGVAPESEFLQHIIDNGYRAAEPEEAQWREALSVLDASRH